MPLKPSYVICAAEELDKMHISSHEYCSSRFTTKVAGTILVSISHVHLVPKISYRVSKTNATAERCLLERRD